MSTILSQLSKDRITFIDGNDVIITRASAYISRTGKSVCVTLYGPKHPRFDSVDVISPKRIYIPIADLGDTETTRNLLNFSSHRAYTWLEKARIGLWKALVVQACVPYRETNRADLTRISLLCRARYGSDFWNDHKARQFMRSELGSLGIKCPPDGAAIHFLSLLSASA